MNDFAYAAPTTLAEAVQLLARANGNARILAGGTDILVQLREHLREAELVIDVKKIPELTEFSYSAAKGLRLGASVPCYRIYEHSEIAKAYPALVDAARIRELNGCVVRQTRKKQSQKVPPSNIEDGTPEIV